MDAKSATAKPAVKASPKARASTPVRTAPTRRKTMSKKDIAEIDAAITGAVGSPGYEMVKALGELAKLGPYPGFRKLGIR